MRFYLITNKDEKTENKVMNMKTKKILRIVAAVIWW